ncbi:hypothetical protein [Brachybacterium sp. GPGPB12]|uniref:hypothetical protein n=1 Tax=Brachybacterium sp. GPGPB12 TaxID=3023517 RepID=UPI00313450F8
MGTPWKADLCAILHTHDQNQRRELIEAFLVAQEPSIARVLARVQRVARLEPRERPVALSYFGQALLQMVDKRWLAKNGGGASHVFNYSSNLPVILEAETRAYLREDRRKGLLDGTAGAPGGDTQSRRDALVQKSRRLFELEYQRPATNNELVAFHNERMHATRKDAARQSVLITRDHLSTARVVPLDDPDVADDVHLTTVDDPDLDVEDRSQLITSVIQRCEALDEDRERRRRCAPRRAPVTAADVARAYFARHQEGEFPTRAELVERLEITEPVARRELGTRLQDVLGLAREAFAGYSYSR